jgi:uncharacterized protein (DUF433 family)
VSKDLKEQPTVVRNERGLSIRGTRVTLYHIMDHVRAGRSAEEIHRWLPMLSRDQVADALAYIEAHRAEVTAEYEQVLQQAAENRRYWEERNRDRLAEVARMPPKPEYAAAWAKLQELKKREAPEE